MSSYRYSSRSAGLERALQHIEEAKQLTRELGGTDKDVKEYFFSLPTNELKSVLDDYESKYGIKAREYAECTWPKWRSGQVTMSGQTASRLFALLPPRMPLVEKYKLTENLWHHVGPSSRKTLRVGPNAKIDDAVETVRDHIEQVVTNYKIPESLERRFNWLSAGDIHMKQELLNHILRMENTLAVEVIKSQLPVMLEHLNSTDGQHTHRLAQVLKVGKHELEILVDKHAQGLKLEEPSVAVRAVLASSSGSYVWIWWLMGFAGLVYVLIAYIVGGVTP